MTTLIEVMKSDGTLVGRCDERCYNATGKRCRCICRGVNHGVGLVQASESLLAKGEKISHDNDGLEVSVRFVQLSFFGRENNGKK